MRLIETVLGAANNAGKSLSVNERGLAGLGSMLQVEEAAVTTRIVVVPVFIQGLTCLVLNWLMFLSRKGVSHS